jgi:hypothetical protein
VSIAGKTSKSERSSIASFAHSRRPTPTAPAPPPPEAWVISRCQRRPSPASPTTISYSHVAARTGERSKQHPISLRQSRPSDLSLQHPQPVTEQQNLDLLLPLRATPKNEQHKQSTQRPVEQRDGDPLSWRATTADPTAQQRLSTKAPYFRHPHPSPKGPASCLRLPAPQVAPTKLIQHASASARTSSRRLPARDRSDGASRLVA